MSNHESATREEICRIGASLYQRGYTVGSAGNISARLDDGWLITPTDACLGFLDPAWLAKVDAGGQPVSGAPPSKTLALHRRIYQASPGSRGIVHTHSTHLVALSLAGVWRADEVIPPITPYQVMKVGPVPLIAYHRPGDPRVADLVAEQIGIAGTALGNAAAEQAPSIRAVLLERLGPVVWHDTVALAAAALEELEETARLWMMLRADPPKPLDAASVTELRHGFGQQRTGP